MRGDVLVNDEQSEAEELSYGTGPVAISGVVSAKIAVTGIEKGFDTERGRLKVVDDLTFSVGQGEIVAIVGPSGCGKSTLLNMLAGFDRPDQGSVKISGNEHSGPSRQGVVITQQGSVFPWLTVQQNLIFALDRGSAKEREEIAQHYIALVGLTGFEQRYPHELSGGMLKRVEIARALAVKPEILFMDEPFSALDALMSLRMQQELLRILEQERNTVVLITHDVEEALRLANRVLVLTHRPTKIKAVFELPYEHPRKLSSPELQEIKDAILAELGLG
jgi:ABC-type nitrate/sulfonate/bicarbonate transport system ATPase subunit